MLPFLFLYRHYALCWAAVLTSPPLGPHLDLWLALLCLLDLAPLAFALGRAWMQRRGRGESEEEEEEEDGLPMALEVAETLRVWSPAFQISQVGRRMIHSAIDLWGKAYS